MTRNRLAILIALAATLAASAITPALAERNTGISASLGKALATTASAFCDGMSGWADSAQAGLVPITGGSGLHPSPIPRSDKKGSDDRAAAQTIRDTGRSMGCPI